MTNLPLLPPLPEGLKVLRNAHGFNHYFTALQMDKYGRDCAQTVLDRTTDEALIAQQAKRLALELECLLNDTQDMAKVSKWWDSAMEALQLYRDACSVAYLGEQK